MDNFYKLLGRRQALQDFLSHGPFPHRLDKLLDNYKVNIGLKENHAHIPQGILYVILGQFSMTTQFLETDFKLF